MMQAAAAEGRANALENAMKAVNTSRQSSGNAACSGMHTRKRPNRSTCQFLASGMKDIFCFCFFIIITRACVL